MASSASSTESPWRPIFEEIRRAVGSRRDDVGILGSINWLRQQMELHGGNPNVVRNIIYRDKGKLNDKRILFEILSRLWQEVLHKPLQAPELELLLSTSSSAEQEVMQLLGREKRRAYRSFVSAVRAGESPKLLITGRPGSGKTLLVDYIQQALDMPPKVVPTVVRLEFSSRDLATSLSHFAFALGLPREQFESRLVAISSASAYAVQADAQANVARSITEAVRQHEQPLLLLLHISQSSAQQDSLGMVPLRLNTPDVPRVSAVEWLWMSLLTPLSSYPQVSLLVSLTELPALALKHPGHFASPMKLNPPTINEARRFIKARLPQLPNSEQEVIVQRAGRSFEDLRTLTLLAELREPLAHDVNDDLTSSSDSHLQQLSSLVENSGDPRLRDFLGALAVLSPAEFPVFHERALLFLRQEPWKSLNNLEQAFLDNIPGDEAYWRCFSRQLARGLQHYLCNHNPKRYRQLNRCASDFYAAQAAQQPRSEMASRYVYHLLEARDWQQLELWLSRYSSQQALLQRIWRLAEKELFATQPEMAEDIALQVANYYVKLDSYNHPDVLTILRLLERSPRETMRAWALLKRAEGAVRKSRYAEAETLLANWRAVDEPLLNTEAKLVEASIARWRAQLDVATSLIRDHARVHLQQVSTDTAAGRLTHAKVAVWAGLIAKDQGHLEEALHNFHSVQSDDELIRARVAFQIGDVQMQLGRYDQAFQALNEAVTLSQGSEALTFEKIRYMARLASLQRQRGDVSGAAATFERVLSIIRDAQDDCYSGHMAHAFERAKVEDERALNLLAQGAFSEAIFVLQRNGLTFRQYQQEHQVDASFRILRNTLSLSLAYWCRGLGQSYSFPLMKVMAYAPMPSDHPDIHHAQALVRQVRQAIDSHPRGGERYGTLYWRTLLMASLLGEADVALEEAQAALAWSRFPYQEAMSRSFLAAGYLRKGALEPCLEEINQAHAALRTSCQSSHQGSQGSQGSQERGDTGLLTWLYGLEIARHAQANAMQRAADALVSGLRTPCMRRYQEALLRVFGEVAEKRSYSWLEHEELRDCLHLPEHMSSQALLCSSIRLPDTLVVHWQQRHRGQRKAHYDSSLHLADITLSLAPALNTLSEHS